MLSVSGEEVPGISARGVRTRGSLTVVLTPLQGPCPKPWATLLSQVLKSVGVLRR